MATPFPGAVQVGSYFVGQYYQVLQQQPELVHQFYSEGSTVIRVDGDTSETASEMLEIHSMVMSLNFTAIEIKTINSLQSWNGGVLVMVSGSVKTKDFSGRRKFVQTFFLAPQEKGYFVLNDIFQFIEDGAVYHQPPSFLSENKREAAPNASSPHPEPPVSDYVLEQEARECVNSVQIEDDPVDKYSLPEQPDHQPEEDFEAEIVVDESPAETYSGSHHLVAETRPDPPVAAEETYEEPTKKTYASILRVAKEASAPVAAAQPSYNKSASTAYEKNQVPQSTPTPQQSIAPSSYVPEHTAEGVEDGSAFEEVEFKSVYVRNLPSTITAAEIEEEFKNFGTIKPDGIFIRNRKDVVGVCYAFVEYEEMSAVENAIKASPVHLAGRQVFIEERRPNPSGIRAGRRGRGRGNYPGEASRGRFGSRGMGRGTNQDGGDYRPRGNGYHQRGSR